MQFDEFQTGRHVVPTQGVWVQLLDPKNADHLETVYEAASQDLIRLTTKDNRKYLFPEIIGLLCIFCLNKLY